MAKRITFCLMALLAGNCVAGCHLFDQHAKMQDTMRGAIAQVAESLGEEGIGQYAAGGQVIDPGIEFEVGVKYFASGRFKGLAGQIQASAQGQMNREMSGDERAAVLRIFMDSSLSAKDRQDAIWRIVEAKFGIPEAGAQTGAAENQTAEPGASPRPPASTAPVPE